MKPGLVHIYTGDGKGKTTAALGLAVRAAGWGCKVHIVFFMKRLRYGEQESLKQLTNVSFGLYGMRRHVNPGHVTRGQRRRAQEALAAAQQAITSGGYDLVILDETNLAAAWGLITVDDLLRLIENKPADVELVLTGRDADQRLIERADYVTRMESCKHPYDRGIQARRGIEC